MNASRYLLTLLVLVLGFSFTKADEAPTKKPMIQLAILLDTSGSMDGLIEQAKTQLWKIVNEFISARKDGVRPELKVALYEYGKQSIPAAEGYLRMIVPLTDDLDKVSEELFALKTNGGDEYCGRVIQAAVNGLLWSEASDDLKVIVIAGNEPFTQGNIDYQEACMAAAKKNIVVNTIFCGNYQEGVQTKWQHGAELGNGMYLNIDQNEKAIHIAAPQDGEITKLGVALNKTYLAYGSKGKKNQLRQAEQDQQAKGASSGSMVQRAVSKSSAYYRNDSWDLVDAVKNESVKLEEMKEEDLPEELQKMTPEERKAYLEKMETERKSIQEKIAKLNDERKKFVANERKKLSTSGKNTLDVVMIEALRKQAERCGFTIE